MFEHLAEATYIPPAEAAALYGVDTGAALRSLAGGLVLKSAREVPYVLEVANREGLKLWPISGGRNFGYGTSLPVAEGSLILDLTQLKAIEHYPESQTVSVEPGVTQQDLADFLEANGLPYMVPTTGVGPNGSLVGNALDGGYGLTPIADHFEALTSVEGFWGSGVPFQHTFTEINCPDMARRWPQGIGPSTQGLLRQGNFGIVTRATIRLARRPEASRVLIFEWPTHQSFFKSQGALSQLTEELPLLGGVIAMNGPRVLSTMADAPLTSELIGTQRARHFEQLCCDRQVAAWTGVGTLYGPKATTQGAVRDIRRRLPGVRVWAFTPAQIRLLQRISFFLPKTWFSAKRRHLGSLVNMLGTVEGRPIVAFLRIAYALDKTSPAMDISRHPAKDGQGILWYAPLVPFTEYGVRRYVVLTTRILVKHGFDPLLAVTTRSSRVHSGTIPLNFRKTEADAARAQACYRELVAAGVAQGMPPYRIGIDYMDQVYAEEGSAHDATWQGLRTVLDPLGVVAPGRYTRA